ncbi:AraC family transcriptional regulator [Antarctobacter sp.]|uniref:AraC-like transcriptional regulator QhpR n=1 Tax=Antarctobacter sp. TaxID=1872577 RepID=UPI003A8FDB73
MPETAQIVATAIRDPIRIVRDLGGDVSQLCAAAAVEMPDLLARPSSLPLRQFVTLNQIAASRLHAPHFGRFVGANFDVTNIGEVGRAAMAAPTLGAALRLVERAFNTVQDETDFRLEVRGGEACLSYRILDANIWPRDQDAELTIGVFASMIARVAGAGWCPTELCFEHPDQGADHRSGAAAFSPVIYQADTNALTFSAGLLDRPMPGGDLRRFQMRSTELTEVAIRLERDCTLVERTRRQVMLTMGNGCADQTLVARQLGLSRRSLRRRLADEGTSFAEILGQCRDLRAMTLLAKTGLPIPEIADRLGYSEASSFERAFRRRTGQTPAAYRRSSADQGA